MRICTLSISGEKFVIPEQLVGAMLKASHDA